MKYVLVILVFTFFQNGNILAQKIVPGMSQEEVRNLFPHYKKQLTDSNSYMAIDSIPHFKFHGVAGMASFGFLSDRLQLFRWVYPKEYYWGERGVIPLLNKRDYRKIAKVFRGIDSDYGQHKIEHGDVEWILPHSVISAGYSPRSFRFEVTDSASFMMLKRGFESTKDTPSARH